MHRSLRKVIQQLAFFRQTRLPCLPGPAKRCSRPMPPRGSQVKLQFTTNVTALECCLPAVLPVIVMEYVPAGVPVWPRRTVVASRKVALADPLPGTTDAGENVQLEAVGWPEQVNATEAPKVPPRAVTVTL